MTAAKYRIGQSDTFLKSPSDLKAKAKFELETSQFTIPFLPFMIYSWPIYIFLCKYYNFNQTKSDQLGKCPVRRDVLAGSS